MVLFTSITFIATFSVFIFFHYLRVSNHYSVALPLKGLLNNFPAVQLAKWLLTAITIVTSAITWGIWGGIASVLILLIANQVIGFISYKLAVSSERRHLLDDPHSRLLAAAVSQDERLAKAEKIAQATIDKNVKSKYENERR